MRWDGANTTTVDTADLSANIAVMCQDYQHWPFTARMNIHIGRTTAEGNGQIETAARDAGAHDMITKLPQGDETLLDRSFKDGHDLSGGQWQRLTTTRTFIRDAPLLICDEPSAALDARAEHAIFVHLRARAGTATTVLITHRLANVRHAVAIYVLGKGHVIEEGTHDQSMELKGRYASLFKLQAAATSATPRYTTLLLSRGAQRTPCAAK
ncbi:ABC transporter ATP-binding protein [Phytomonospora sp. NPDC050363]|uniref:ABC transporter ATP-binding protein n=1 Tax=Phytomonospora sp. NPDC050363 TaxID=3155642 RepID=UPI0033F97F98